MQDDPTDKGFVDELRRITPKDDDISRKNVVEQKIRQESAKADEIEQRNKKRYEYANCFIRAAFLWLLFVGVIVLASSLEICPISISDTVLVALLTTSTVNVLAPAFLVAKYLFSSRA